MNIRKWLAEHSVKLLAIRDVPNAIAGGVAIGVFFGFTPLFGLKMLLSLLFAWLFRCNLLAAAIGVTLHDIALPFMPFILRMEYDVGYWLLSSPHQLPVSMRHLHWNTQALRSWTTFTKVGWPLLLGSAACATPVTILSFVLTRLAVMQWQKKNKSKIDPADGVE